MELKKLQKKYQNINFKKGVYLRDKSHKFDCVYFCTKFIYDYAKKGYFYLDTNLDTLKRYLSNRFSIDINDSLNNFYREPLELLEIANVIEKQADSKYKILDQEIITFISERPENAYIFNYVIAYYMLKNNKCLSLYNDFCDEETNVKKKEYVEKIHSIFVKNNPYAKKANTNWRRQITKYILENLSYINSQPHTTRTLNVKNISERMEMISINVKGTRSTKNKNNSYLSKFDNNYVKEFVKPLLIYSEGE